MKKPHYRLHVNTTADARPLWWVTTVLRLRGRSKLVSTGGRSTPAAALQEAERLHIDHYCVRA